MFRKFILLILIILSTSTASAGERILFVPHDDRPISSTQTAEVIAQLGYEILMPPKNLLGLDGSDNHPEKLWAWINDNIKSAKAAVIASDSMLYGGLIPSRKHNFTDEIITARVENFKLLREYNPDLKVYIFSSLMRTPMSGTKGDIEEPDYYAEHGANIFNYTALIDKQEISALTADEIDYLAYLKNIIPTEILNDWLGRRNKNLAATKKLIDFKNSGIIDYLVIGRDDNAPFGQTHKENRELQAYADIKSLAGIDEFNLLLLTRAVNELRGDVPTVNVQYNIGTGANTIPAFSDETIAESINDAVEIIGGKIIDNPARADLVLLVNTDINGETLWAHNRTPDGNEFIPNLKPTAATNYFAKLIEDSIDKNYAVGIADINFANGSDNALMKILHDKNLLFKVQSYAGWNTATNSTGFALATGVLAKNMTVDAKNRLLARRYLDDWAYQANIRAIVGNKLYYSERGAIEYYQFENERANAESEETRLINEFAKNNLPPFKYLRNMKVTNTWNRMFEGDIKFGDE